MKFTVNPIRDDKYIIAKLKIFNGTNRTTFTFIIYIYIYITFTFIIPIEKNNYTCIAVIDIDSVLKIDNKRAYPQAYLEQCKYKLGKRKHVNFIEDEIVDEDSDSDLDSAVDSHNNFSVPDSYVVK